MKVEVEEVYSAINAAVGHLPSCRQAAHAQHRAVRNSASDTAKMFSRNLITVMDKQFDGDDKQSSTMKSRWPHFPAQCTARRNSNDREESG